jgi:hypothetical protein
MPQTVKRVILLLSLLGALLVGCGGDNGGSPDAFPIGPEVAALVERVPGTITSITAMDLSGAKRELGLPADLDPADYGGDTPSGRERFDNAALKLFGYLTGVYATPAAAAIDHGRATAAISAFTGPGAKFAIIATSQPTSEIQRGLEQRDGLRRIAEGAYVVEDDELSGPQVVALGDGLIVIAASLELARSALEGGAPDRGTEALREQLEGVRGALRVVNTEPASSVAAPCVRAIVGGQRFDSRTEEDLVLTLSEPPDPRRVLLGTEVQREEILVKDYRVLGSTVRGQTLRLRVGVTPDAPADSNAATIADGVGLEQAYRCQQQAEPPPARDEPVPDPVELGPPPGPDTSGTPFETAVSSYIAAASTASNAVRVRCPGQQPEADAVRCTGTRPDDGEVYRYTIVVNLDDDGIQSVEIESPDDRTGTIL